MLDSDQQRQIVTIDIKAFGIDPMMGGASMLISAQIAGSSTQVDEGTGEAQAMVEVVWLGGSQYYFLQPGDQLAQLPVGTKVLISAKQKKGKKGFYNDRDTSPTVVLIDGKAA